VLGAQQGLGKLAVVGPQQQAAAVAVQASDGVEAGVDIGPTPQGSQVDHTGYAGKILQENPGRQIWKFGRSICRWTPAH